MQTILFFDLDATLVENNFSRKAISPLLQEIADASGISLSDLGRAMGAENSRRQKDDPDNVLTMDWGDILESLARKYDVKLSDTVDNLWRMAASKEYIEVLDDAHSALEKLRNGNRKLILATKGLYKYQIPVLELTGLLHYFDDILTPDKTGYLKTSPQYFDSYRNEKTLFIQVGDHYYDDVICAKRNGFLSIMRAPIIDLYYYDPLERCKYLDKVWHEISTYPKEGTDIRPDAIVLSLQELPSVVEEFEKRAY